MDEATERSVSGEPVGRPVLRVWRGWTTTARAAAYEEYMHRTAIPAYTSIPGNRMTMLTSRRVGDNTEFFFITLWDSMEAVREFAGDDPQTAVFFEEDDDFLVDRDLDVRHYGVFWSR